MIAWFDLGVTALFILPPVAALLLSVLMGLEQQLFGPARVSALPAAQWFIFMSLMGILGVVWAVARLWLNDDRLWYLDAMARCVVALMLVQAIVFSGLPLVFGAFVATELIGAAWVWLVARRR
jgi:hypothetical protein